MSLLVRDAIDREITEITAEPAPVPSLRETLRTLVAHRFLLRQLSLREFLGVYKGSFLGALWSWLYPLILLAVYAFIFSRVFKMRWSLTPKETLGSFALILFCGFIPFNLLSQVLQRSSSIIVQNTNLVSKVVFPLDLLPVSVVVAALLNAGVATIVLLLGELVVMRSVPVEALYLVPLALIVAILALGIAYFLAAMGVFVRDVANLVPVVMQMLFFMTPITYPLEAIPEKYRAFFLLNPLAPIVIDWRNVVLSGHAPHWRWLGVLFVGALVVLFCGHFLFHRTRRAFTEVL